MCVCGGGGGGGGGGGYSKIPDFFLKFHYKICFLLCV